MEKEEYKAQLDVACEKFRKLMAAQLSRGLLDGQEVVLP